MSAVKTRKASLIAGAQFYGTCDAFRVVVSKTAECGWCSLRLGPHKIHNTPTCAECRDGGRAFRVRMGVERLRRAAENKR